MGVDGWEGEGKEGGRVDGGWGGGIIHLHHSCTSRLMSIQSADDDTDTDAAAVAAAPLKDYKYKMNKC